MKSIFSTALFLLFFGISAFAQNKSASIKGTVKDQENNPLPMATVMLLQASDSVLTTFALSDDKGEFLLSKTSKGKYILQVSFLGYKNFSKPLEISGNEESMDAGSIQLEQQSEVLSEVVVEGEANPLNIKKDTVEYNAVAFKTQPNAVAEELLKRLPGVEVEADGTVKAQGQNVTRILVDGKEFFGRDPKMATRNLPADAIDKIQIFDKLSDQAEFSGVDDGDREKTINISLRADRRRGYFGNASLAGGSSPDLPASDQGRFESKLSINNFSKNQQVSFIGMGNNTNQEGFSMDDYVGFTGGGGGGGGGRSGGGGGSTMRVMSFSGGGGGFGGGNSSGIPISGGPSTGFIETYAAGLNFNRSISGKTDLQSSYFFSLADRNFTRNSAQETFLNNSSFFSNNASDQTTITGSHRLNLTLEHKIDSTQNIRIVTRGSFSNSDYSMKSSSESLNNLQKLTNESIRDNTSDGENFSLNSNLLYRKRFGKRGRNFSANLTLVAGNDNSDGFNNSFNGFYTGPPRKDTLNQNFLQTNNRFNYGGRFSFVEPAGGNHFLEFVYNYQLNKNDFNREVYDNFGFLEPQINVGLTNQYEVAFSYHQGGLNWRYANEKFNASLGANYQQSLLDGTLLLSETVIRRDFSAVLPNFRMRWQFKPSKFVNLNYRTNIQEPSIQQLQPVADNTNPLSIYEGNPELKPEYSHSAMLNIGSFNQFSFTNIFGFLNFTYTKDRIRNAQTIDQNFVTTTRPINVDDDYRLNSSLSFGTRIRPVKMNINLDLGYNWNRGITFINGVSNWTINSIPNVGLRLENYRKEIVDWSIAARLRFTHTTYSVATEQNRDFINHTYTANVMVPVVKNRFNIGTNLNYAVYTGITDDFNTDIPIWNAYMNLFVMKNQKGQLRLSVFDILNRNQGINIVNDLNYTLSERTLSLGRYFTLGFTYTFRNLAGAGGGGNGGGMQMPR